jgi:hypothetical protein
MGRRSEKGVYTMVSMASLTTSEPGFRLLPEDTR